MTTCYEQITRETFRHAVSHTPRVQRDTRRERERGREREKETDRETEAYQNTDDM